jgi:putative oxidoreductase
MKALVNLYALVAKKLESLACLPPLFTRIAVGIVFIESGWGKIHNIPKVAEFFTSLQIPAPYFQAHFVAYSEFIFGLLLLIGLLTRLAAVPLIFIMIVAILTAKLQDMQTFTDLFGFSEFLYILLLFWILIRGPGSISLDHIYKKKRQ